MCLSLNLFVRTHPLTIVINNQMNNVLSKLQSIIWKHVFVCKIKLQLHGAIYRPDSFVLMLRYCANLKAIRYESTSLNRIVADKSHRVIVALENFHID